MSMAPGDFDFVRNLVAHRSAIALAPDQMVLVESRLLPVARAQGIPTLADLVNRLRRELDGPLHKAVIEAMTTGETSFFRDIHPFEALRKEILPKMIAHRAQEKRLSIWCAACSTGQEPYSVAMTLQEHFSAQLMGWSVDLYATDLSTAALTRAGEGRFSQLEINRGLPATMLVRYFDKRGVDFFAKERLRQLITFKQLNFVAPFPSLPSFDIVFVRNVLIYFPVPTKAEILARVKRVMSPAGYLFLGSAETLFNVTDDFEREEIGKTAVYRPTTTRGIP